MSTNAPGNVIVNGGTVSVYALDSRRKTFFFFYATIVLCFSLNYSAIVYAIVSTNIYYLVRNKPRRSVRQ